MIRFALATLASLLPGQLLAACTGADLTAYLSPSDIAEIDAATVATPYGEGLFWSATKDGTELRLIGTMHIHDPRHEALMPQVTEAMTGAGLVMLELTPSEEAQAEQAMLTEPDRLFITDGPTLPEMLDEATWQDLADAARSRQIPAFLAAKFQPWYLAMSLAMPACAMPDLLAGRRGLDHRIMALAEANGQPMQALEPWDTLFGLMAQDSLEEQLDMLRLSIVPDDLQIATMVSMLDGYFEGSIAEVWETSRVSARLVPGLDRAEAERLFLEMQTDLLDTRNRAWIPVIEEAAKDHDVVVVAVGAAHLPGEVGVLRLLEARGWTIGKLQQE